METPSTDRAPFLIVCDDTDKNVKCYIVSDPLFVESPLNAMILLIATYWVFDVSFDKHFENQLILLSMTMFGKKAERILGPFGIQSLSVNNLLLKAKL